MKNVNPFNPNSIVRPNLFGGRAAQVLKILTKLRQVKEGMSSGFAFHGVRGIGKTALAKLIMDIARSRNPDLENLNFLCAYYSAEKNQNFASVLESVLNQLVDQIPKGVLDSLTARLGDFFKNNKFSLSGYGVTAAVEGQGSKKTNGTPPSLLKDYAVKAIQNLITSIREQSPTEKQFDGILIVIDEIQNIKDRERIASVLRGVATTLDVQSAAYFSFIIIGYDDAIEDFFGGDESARRYFDSVPLTYMPKEDAKEIYTKGFESAEITFSDEELTKNIDAAGGYPHAIQIIGHYLIEADTDGFIDGGDWEKALINAAKELQTKDFAQHFNFGKKKTVADEIVSVLAFSQIAIPKSLIDKEFKRKNKNIYTKGCLPKLIENGAVRENKETSELELFSPLFRSAVLLELSQSDWQHAWWFDASLNIQKDLKNELQRQFNGITTDQ